MPEQRMVELRPPLHEVGQILAHIFKMAATIIADDRKQPQCGQRRERKRRRITRLDQAHGNARGRRGEPAIGFRYLAMPLLDDGLSEQKPDKAVHQPAEHRDRQFVD